MKRFDRIKTIQLAVLAGLTALAIVTILRDEALYHLIAADPHIRRLCLIFWIAMGLSFVFLFYDFQSFSNLRRENMELDHAIYADALTGMANRYSVDVYLGQYLNKPLPKDMGCITLELTNLKEINAALGHGGGDAAIQSFSELLTQAATGVCFIGRNGGDKFAAIFQDCSRNRIDLFLQAVEDRVQERNAAGKDLPLAYAVGVAFDEGEAVQSLTALLALSDRRAWQNMTEGQQAEKEKGRMY